MTITPEIKMNPSQMADRANFIAMLSIAFVGTYLALRNNPESMLDLGEISERKGIYEPYVQYEDDKVVVSKSLFTELDLEKYLDPQILKKLPTPAVGENVGASWLVEKTAAGSECRVMLLHFATTDQYFAINSLDGNKVKISEINENPGVQSQLSIGRGKILDVMIERDEQLRVIYKNNQKDFDFLASDVAGNYNIVK